MCYACGFKFKCVKLEITNEILKLAWRELGFLYMVVKLIMRISLHGREINYVVSKSVAHSLEIRICDPKSVHIMQPIGLIPDAPTK